MQQGGPKVELPAFDPKIVTDIYSQELGGGGQKPAKLKRIMLLEISQYLENYLWPHFDAGEPRQQGYSRLLLSLICVRVRPQGIFKVRTDLQQHTAGCLH